MMNIKKRGKFIECEVDEFSKEFNKHIKEKGKCKDYVECHYGTFIPNDKCGLNNGCCIKKQYKQ